MRLLALALLLAVGPMFAQDAPALLEKADQLERQAEKLLDQGRKAQALELLTKAADLREQARAGAGAQETEAKAKARAEKAKAKEAKAKQAQAKKAEAKRAKAKATADAKRAAGLPESARASLAAMDAALGKGDVKAATNAGRTAHRQLMQWHRQLERRERELRRRGAPDDVQRRVAVLEEQVAELRRLLDAPR